MKTDMCAASCRSGYHRVLLDDKDLLEIIRYIRESGKKLDREEKETSDYLFFKYCRYGNFYESDMIKYVDGH